MDLAKKIEKIYLDRNEELSLEKKFHFASRLYSFFGHTQAKVILDEIKVDFVAKDNHKKLTELLNQTPDSSINAYEIRKPYFEKYPKLYGLELALFYVRHLLCIYKIDIRRDLLEIIDVNEINDIVQKILQDPKATSALSTYIINTAYIASHLFDDSIKLRGAVPMSLDGNAEVSPDEIKLKIYLITHCVIGATNFYHKGLSNSEKSDYLKHLLYTEKMIKNNFENVSLDNKFEFLVCAKICQFTPSIKDKIYDEANKSLDETGSFIVDKHNFYAGKTKSDLSGSEHRNVLYIMSTKEFKPLLG